MVQLDQRIGGITERLLVREQGRLPMIHPIFKTCVVFLGYKDQNGQFRPTGTGFFYGRKTPGLDGLAVYLVTARHVVNKSAETDRGCGTIVIRCNGRDGRWIECNSRRTDWLTHPDPDIEAQVDIAVIPFQIQPNMDQQAIPPESWAPAAFMEERALGVGDEVCAIGLFSSYPGANKNEPIIRFGRIAAMPEHQVYVNDIGNIDAYLVECRSTGGMSGAPVLIIERHWDRVEPFKVFPTYELFLLGMIQGHFRVIEEPGGDGCEDILENAHVATVIPAEKIGEVLDQDAVRANEERLVLDYRHSRGA